MNGKQKDERIGYIIQRMFIPCEAWMQIRVSDTIQYRHNDTTSFEM